MYNNSLWLLEWVWARGGVIVCDGGLNVWVILQFGLPTFHYRPWFQWSRGVARGGRGLEPPQSEAQPPWAPPPPPWNDTLYRGNGEPPFWVPVSPTPWFPLSSCYRPLILKSLATSLQWSPWFVQQTQRTSRAGKLEKNGLETRAQGMIGNNYTTLWLPIKLQ